MPTKSVPVSNGDKMIKMLDPKIGSTFDNMVYGTNNVETSNNPFRVVLMNKNRR